MDMNALESALLKAHESGNTEHAKILAEAILLARQQSDDMSWSDVPLKALFNAPASGARLAAGLGHAIAHPVDTTQSLLDIANGGLQHLLPQGVNDFMHRIAPDTANNPAKADAAGAFYAQRYGTTEGFKHALAEDPAGVMADASTLLTGGGGLAAKVPQLAKAGNLATNVGKSIDPIIAASKAAASVVKGGRMALTDSVTGKILTKAGQLPPEALAEQIRQGNVPLVTPPTTTQAAQNPGISQLDRTVRNFTYNPMIEMDQAQNAARKQALNSVPGVGPLALSTNEAAENAGDLIRQSWEGQRSTAKAAERAAFNSPLLNDLTFTLPTQTLRQAIETYYPGLTYDQAPNLLRKLADAPENTLITHQELQKMRSMVGELSRDLHNTDATGRGAALAAKQALSDVYEQARQAAADKLAVTGEGHFGPVYGNLSGDPGNAIAHLLRTGKGEVPAAAENQIMGPVSFVAGEPVKKGAGAYGLLHIEAKDRNDVLSKLPTLIEDGSPYSRLQQTRTGELQPKAGNTDIYFIGDGTYEAVIRNEFDRQPRDQWNHTAYRVDENKKLPVEVSQLARATHLTPKTQAPSATTGNPPRGATEAQSALGTESIAKNPRAYQDLMPQDAETIYRQALALHRQRKERLESGPGHVLTRMGPDGWPAKQGAEIPPLFFNSKASQQADIGQFNTMFAQDPQAMDALRRYALTDLEQRTTLADGSLSNAHMQTWMKDRSGAVNGLFTPDQTQAINTIAQDLNRASTAQTLGKAIGSNTGQNMQSLFSSGLIDPLLHGISFMANKTPGIKSLAGPVVSPVAEWLRAENRKALVAKVGDALLNPDRALLELDKYAKLKKPNKTQRWLLDAGMVASPYTTSLLPYLNGDGSASMTP